jgi:hypothetical protein
MEEEKEPTQSENSEQAKQEQKPTEAEQSKTISKSKPSVTKRRAKSKKKTAKKPKTKSITAINTNVQAKYPRHSVKKALRIPRAILEQNAGKECSETEAVGYLGSTLNGEIRMEISSAIKFGLLERPAPKRVRVSELARKILRPQQLNDETEGLREAVLMAPDISDVYKHYRGENLPDEQFFINTLVDTFHIPQSKVVEFKTIFIESLKDANLLEQHNDKWRVLDVSLENRSNSNNSETIKKLGKSVNIEAGDSCFVLMPFAPPLGNHYSLIFEPAIKKAGLKPVRADDDIFATGKIMDQVWRGITSAKVLVAELTSRNPNVFYELGIAHALKKPVVLISRNEEDVPFDVRHIRVIYYDLNDPFWGDKLLAKIAENILSAIKNPEEAIFEGIRNISFIEPINS